MVGQKELVGLLVQRAGVTAWTYEAHRDCLTYCRSNESDFLEASGFKKGTAAKEWEFLWNGKPSGFADVHDTPWQKGGNFRMTYLRVGGDGNVVGLAEELDSETVGACGRAFGRRRGIGKTRAARRDAWRGLCQRQDLFETAQSLRRDAGGI